MNRKRVMIADASLIAGSHLKKEFIDQGFGAINVTNIDDGVKTLKSWERRGEKLPDVYVIELNLHPKDIEGGLQFIKKLASKFSYQFENPEQFYKSIVIYSRSVVKNPGECLEEAKKDLGVDIESFSKRLEKLSKIYHKLLDLGITEDRIILKSDMEMPELVNYVKSLYSI